ncbi:LPP20 family lipoprotein [Litoribacillus peritrichatus]|uniref:Lipoprotein LPP20-like domain-containing protein n=1 Tax=Litoribacillus peritrichatus TaxID=718191 RepID=A0ABP7MNW2_9GAMM
MVILRAALAGLMLVGLVACKSSHIVEPAPSDQRVSQGAPSWVVSPPVDAQYLYGIGSSEVYGDRVRAIQKADDVARSDLIKQLKVSVSQSLTATTQTENDSAFLKTEVIVSSKVPETEMVGIERLETYVDQQRQIAYVLVRLDRPQAIRSLKSGLAQTELELAVYERYPVGSDLMRDIRALMPALPLIRKYELNLEKLELLSANDKDKLAGIYKPTDLKLRIYELISKVSVRLEPQNQKAQRLEAMLTHQLTKLEMDVVTDQSSELVIKYSLDIIEKEQQNTHFILMNADVKVVDAGNHVITAGVLSAKGGAYDKDIAYKRALAKISDKLETEVVKGILEAI